MAQRNVTQVNSALFTHLPTAKRLVAEISDIMVKRFDPLYDDAVDVGIALRNPKTGNVTRWAVGGEIRCGTVDNELQGWQLFPTPESVYRNPKLKGYSMTILND